MADNIETRVAILEQIARNTEALLKLLDQRMERIETRMERIETRIDRIEDRMERHFLWLLGLYLAGFASLLGVLAHGFHWL